MAASRLIASAKAHTKTPQSWNVKRHHKNTAAALHARVAEKNRKYEAIATAAGYKFFPVVFDALGAPHSGVKAFVELLADIAVQKGLIDRSAAPFWKNAACSRLAFAVLEASLPLFEDSWRRNARVPDFPVVRVPDDEDVGDDDDDGDDAHDAIAADDIAAAPVLPAPVAVFDEAAVSLDTSAAAPVSAEGPVVFDGFS